MNDPIELDWLARWATYTPNAVAMIDDELGRSLDLPRSGGHLLKQYGEVLRAL